MKNTIWDCKLIELARHDSPRLGNLSVVQSNETVPFDVQRVFYIYDVPAGETRASHAHRSMKEFIVAVSGSFCATLDDGKEKRTVMLNRPFMGLLIEPGVWLTLHDFSSGAVCLALASEPYIPEDNINDYTEFLELFT